MVELERQEITVTNSRAKCNGDEENIGRVSMYLLLWAWFDGLVLLKPPFVPRRPH